MMKYWMAIILLPVGIILGGCGKNAVTEKHVVDLQEQQVLSDNSSESDHASSSVKESLSNKSGDTKGITGVDISFDFNRASGPASNQIAVWVEDSDENVVKTLYVSDFTGRARGYEKRKDALKHWVADAKPEKMTDQKIDAISSATPNNGIQKISWDLTDSEGREVPNGTYRICLEGTLFWSSNALYSGNIDLLNDQPGEAKVQEDRSEADNTKNASMIQNVVITEK